LLPSLKLEQGGKGVSVEYQLAAKIPGSLFSQSIAACKITLPFTTARRRQAYVHPYRHTYEQSGLSGCKFYYQVGDDGILREPDAIPRFNSEIYSNKNLKFLWCKIGVQMESSIGISEAVPAHLTVRCRNPESRVQLPELYLRAVKVVLFSRVRIRFPERATVSRGEPNIVNVIELVSKNGLREKVPTDGKISLNKILDLRLDEGKEEVIGPSFISFAMRRDQELRFQFAISCFENQYESAVIQPHVLMKSSKFEDEAEEGLPQYKA
jgi:hypothetical protein